MPVPVDLDAWRNRWTGPQVRALGMRGDAISDGVAEFVVEQPYGDARDEDPLWLLTAIVYAIDIAVVSAVGAHLDSTREQSNGTASLYMNLLEPRAQGTVRVVARVAHWGTHQALVEYDAKDEAGTLIALGMSGYSIRQKQPGDPNPMPQNPTGAPPPGQEQPVPPAFFEAFGVSVAEQTPGYTRLEIDRSKIQLRGIRASINGGIVASLMHAGALALLEAGLEPGERLGAMQECSVTYLSAARGDETRVEARLLRKGGRLAVVEAEVHDAATGTVNARSLISWVLERPPRANEGAG